MPDLKPLITTVIPTYRRPGLLRRAVMSVLAQTYPHFQICIYDNASGDETENVVRDLSAADSRVKYFSHRQNIGAIQNFVFGMGRVETAFFSLLSDDDVLLPEFFEKALAGFDKHPTAMFSALATIHADGHGNVTSVPLLAWEDGIYLPPQGLVVMLERQHPEWTAILFRREVLESVGTLDPETGAPSDFDYELRIAARWPIAISREPGAIWISHDGSISSAARIETAWIAWQKVAVNIAAQQTIPLEVRLQAQRQLHHNFRKRFLALDGLAYVIKQDWAQAEHAARILREGYDKRSKAWLLQLTSRAAQRFPFLLGLLKALNSVRKSIRAIVSPRVAPDYARYAALLKGGNEEMGLRSHSAYENNSASLNRSPEPS